MSSFDRPDDPYPGRREVHELTAAELREHPAWWFPPPDGHLTGPDLGTVMPADAGAADATGACEFPAGRWLLRAEFVLDDGTALDGHVTYVAGETSDATTQEPTLCTPRGQVPLWHGVVVPDANAVARMLAQIGKPRGAVFPVTWRAVLHPSAHDLSGTADGFLVWQNGRVEAV